MTQDSIAAITAAFTQQVTAAIQADLRASQPQSTSITPRLMRAKEAGEYIGRSEQAVRHLIFQRDLPVVRNGRCVRIDRKDLDTWIDRNKC
jgi:excisionase family DNA binding protein